MPPTRQQVQCPNCGQPVAVEVQQLFDLNEDPTAKQRLLSGTVNLIQCPVCGYQGNLGTPVVYHDPEKELLLTHVPAELGLSRDDQERAVGQLITKVVDRLPQDQRKGYLLSPETTLTFQRLIERVLEEDGITPEMIEAQQKRLQLIQRLLDASEDARAEIVQQEEELLDAQFFTLLNRLVDASLMGGDQGSAQQLRALQEELLPQTAFGREVQTQTQEIEAAVQSLQELGEDLTRDKLLDLMIEAPSDTRLSALVSLTRPAIDYGFFQALSERIDQAEGERRETLTALRERLLELTRQIDQQVEARMVQSRSLLNELLGADDIAEATLQNLPEIDEFFVQSLNGELEAARQQGQTERLEKLRTVVDTLQRASAPPPEVELIQELLDAPGQKARREILESRMEEVTPQLLDALTALLNQAQSGGDQALAGKLRDIHKLAVRMSMEANLRSG